MSGKNLYSLAYSILVYVLYVRLFKDILEKSLHSEYYSHCAWVPLVSACFLFTGREYIPLKNEFSPKTGFMVISAGFLAYACLTKYGLHLTEVSNLALLSLMAITLWTGGLVLFYGLRSLRTVAIPLFILTFMFPLPLAVMEEIVLFLQIGSVYVAEGLFRVSGVPYTRDGLIFYLPTLYIEVAKQCSGIHSTIALVISGVFAAFVFLRNTGKRVIFVLSIIPVTLFKNGLRIFVLSVLGVYGNEGILVDGWLHRSGGILFFIIALSFLWVVLRLLGMERITTPRNTEAYD